jgi:hypothetical protein
VPEANLPDGLEKTANKGVANGYAGLDASGKLGSGLLPSGLEQTANNGIADGYAPLGADILVPNAYLPEASGTTRGILRLATDAEAVAGTLETVSVNPKQLDAAASALLPKSGGAMTGTLMDAAAAQARNVALSTTDLTPGTSALPTGQVYLVYE